MLLARPKELSYHGAIGPRGTLNGSAFGIKGLWFLMPITTSQKTRTLQMTNGVDIKFYSKQLARMPMPLFLLPER